MTIFKTPFLLILLTLSIFLSSCGGDNPIVVDVPSTYAFERNGESSVSYSGQTQRLDMLQELMEYAKSGTSNSLNINQLLNMLHNNNNPFAKSELNQEGDKRKQIASKLYGQGDGLTPVDGGITLKHFEDLLQEIASISELNIQTAENGKAGTLTSGSSTYLVNANGFEPAQLLEKGLMSALLFHQGTNVYLGGDKLSASAIELESEKNYTTLEHHFDEAYGYFELPTDMSKLEEMGSNKELRYWAKYVYERTGTDGIGYDLANKIHENFRTARACIAAQYDHNGNEIDCSYENAITTIKTEWELMAAANVVHYLNSAKTQVSDQAKLSHSLSECVGFLKALEYANSGDGRLTNSQIDEIMKLIGENLWEIIPANLDLAIDKVISKYNELADVKDQL